MSTQFSTYPAGSANSQHNWQSRPRASKQADIPLQVQVSSGKDDSQYEISAIKSWILDCLAVHPKEVRNVLDAARQSPFDGLADDQIRASATVLADLYGWAQERLASLGPRLVPTASGYPVQVTLPAIPIFQQHERQVPVSSTTGNLELGTHGHSRQYHTVNGKDLDDGPCHDTGDDSAWRDEDTVAPSPFAEEIECAEELLSRAESYTHDDPDMHAKVADRVSAISPITAAPPDLHSFRLSTDLSQTAEDC